MSHLKQYIDYINNTGGSPTIAQFDEDWEPIGPTLRADMIKYKMITERDGKLYVNEGAKGNV